MCSVSFVRIGGTQLLVSYASVCPVEENPPFDIRRSQAIPVLSGLVWSGVVWCGVCEGTHRQVFHCLWVVSSGLKSTCPL